MPRGTARIGMLVPITNTNLAADMTLLRANGGATNHSDAQAVDLSCTDMRSVEINSRFESQLGKSVITSNQAMRIAALRHLEQSYEQGFGRLFQSLAKEKA
jgi:maleate cis-trans isomerase